MSTDFTDDLTDNQAFEDDALNVEDAATVNLAWEAFSRDRRLMFASDEVLTGAQVAAMFRALKAPEPAPAMEGYPPLEALAAAFLADAVSKGDVGIFLDESDLVPSIEERPHDAKEWLALIAGVKDVLTRQAQALQALQKVREHCERELGGIANGADLYAQGVNAACAEVLRLLGGPVSGEVE